MHVRISRRRRNGKTYEYPQLVESYRRESDGMPAHRVVMSLKHLSPVELDNLKVALAASREGKRVVVARAPVAQPERPAANLRYLDVAVLHELWRRFELNEVFDDLLPIGDALVPPSAIIEALAIQRCVAPGSKLYAERWFPRTALPELLGVSPEHFNNTRLHRLLNDLDQSGPELMAKLPRRYTQRQGASAALFLDVTDTWFVGHGPKLAERAKTKEGFIRRKVGIVLLCNELGYPLRWEVIRGRESDKEAMGRLTASLRGLSWVGETPLVCDRSMGNTAQLQHLLGTSLRFVTALVRTEFSAYTEDIPHRAFSGFVVVPWENAKQMSAQAARVGQLAEQAGLHRVDDRLYVLDLGIVERPSDSGAAGHIPDDQNDLDPVIEAMRLGRQIREALAEGKVDSLAAAGRRLGLKPGATKKYRRLASLAEEVQLAVLEGRASGVSLGKLLALHDISDLDAQREAFEDLVQMTAARSPRRPTAKKSTGVAKAPGTPALPVRVRAVAYFNPEIFLTQRLGAQIHLAEIDVFVDTLNRRLAKPRTKMTKTKIAAEIQRKLGQHGLVEAFDVQIRRSPEDDEQPGPYVVALRLRPEPWARRRRYDGFSLLVAHPEISLPPADLCRLYRSRDIVEKDFRTIKSLVKLHPVRHRLDAKVRAHVSICMLSLLLERALDNALGTTSTSGAALEELATCHLNSYAGDSGTAYTLTDLTKPQRDILRKLHMGILGDELELMDRISPR